MSPLQLFGTVTSSVRTPRSRLLIKLSAAVIASVSSLVLGGTTTVSATTLSDVGPVQVIPGVSHLAAVSCNGNHVCVAVGTDAEGGEVLPITDGTPGTVSTVTGSDQDLSDLSLASVDCTGPTWCTAVGSAYAPYPVGLMQGVGVIVEIEDGIPVSIGTVTGQGTVGTGDDVSLSQVSCYGQACVAVGNDEYLGPIIVSGAAESVAPTAGASFNGIACHGNGACVAVGDFGTYNSNGYSGMLPIDQGIAGSAKPSDASNAVACHYSSLTCIGVGSESAEGSTGSVGDVVIITKRSPGTGETVAGSNGLDSAACAGPEYCVAAGSNSSNQGVLVTIAGSYIRRARAVVGSAVWSSVSCSNVDFCIVIGDNAEEQTVFTTFGLPAR